MLVDHIGYIKCKFSITSITRKVGIFSFQNNSDFDYPEQVSNYCIAVYFICCTTVLQCHDVD